MEDYIIARLIRRALAAIVLILIVCALVYGWWTGDSDGAFKKVYIKPMEYVMGLVLQPQMNRIERARERIASSTNSGA